ncbi:hypothetical protein ACFV4T_12490 [Streptomyces sp. NPDC059755]|uniref:hypothetical protein n=1 Tax=Streptomyces sp. NPDC059755 TaxID=3346934 RepID=UPI003648BD2B
MERAFTAVLRGVELAQLVFRPGKTHLQSFDLAEPALCLSLDDAGEEVVADLDQAATLVGIGRRREQRTQACSSMQAVP